MPLVVNTNMTAMNAVGNLSRTTRKLSSTFGRISSGLRINSAGDDAAGLAVAENLDAAGRSLVVAKRNAMDGMSVIQVAEGATAEVGTILKRMRELAVQSASETLADSERAYIQDEYLQLSSEVDRISQVTNFNGLQLADGATTSIDVQVGIFDSTNDRIVLLMADLRSTSLGVDSGSMDLSTATGAQAALTLIDTALDQVSAFRSDFGSVSNRLESAMRNLDTYTENMAASESRIRDADFAWETAEMSKFQIMQQAGVAVLGQANQLSQGVLRLLG